ncbi:hypothetical protein XELAEV_18037741mg [Xenopus laevis]|uniref:Uncharacterized protein n=1 Tax=Xenopus laevis TaxID=8355 RepID=A0A974HAH0_XENLA|nr:hypothetical protein XELAEV_18037741mg [Xenopus laevis]
MLKSVHSCTSTRSVFTPLDLPKPTISGETNYFDSEGLQIHCTAPPLNKRMWFRLISENGTEQEINDVESKNVTFFIKDPRHMENKYYCDYRIRIGNDFAYSKVSNAAITGSANILRLLLAALILVATAAITFNHFNTLHRSIPLDQPSDNVTFTMESVVTATGQKPGNVYID